MISFIVPAYNEELELPSTIAAIHAATSGAAQAYEIIVVDDASTDATPEMMPILGLIGPTLWKRSPPWNPATPAAAPA
jgi:cellulose synthase/poly-beta-1,6-N-acetylglucosamine synthase-like glycosyltransferase